MSVSPFVVPGSSQFEELRLSLQADTHRWFDDWSSVSAEVGVRVQNTDFDALHERNCLSFTGSGDADWGIVMAGPEKLSNFAMRMLMSENAEARGDQVVACQFAQRALSELMYRWLGVKNLHITTGMVAELIPEASTRPGTGVLTVLLSIDRCGIECLLPIHGLLMRFTVDSSWSKESSAPVAVERALGSQRVALQASLGDVELSLDAMTHLQPGDVLVLDKLIASPLSLRVTESDYGFSGYLGSQNDSLAFRIAGRLEDLDEQSKVSM